MSELEGALVDTTPIAVDGDLVSLSTTAFDERILEALAKLSTAIAQNGQVLSSVLERVDALEENALAFRVESRESLAAERARLKDCEMHLGTLERVVSTVRDEMVMKDMQTAEMKSIADDISSLSSRVRVIEGGGCVGIVDVTREIAKDIAEGMISHYQERVDDYLTSETTELRRDMGSLVASECNSLQVQTAAVLSKFRTEMEEDWSRSLDTLAEADTRNMAKTGMMFYRVCQQVNGYTDDVTALAVSGLRRLRDLMLEQSDGLGALYSLFLLDPEVCRSLCGTPVRIPQGDTPIPELRGEMDLLVQHWKFQQTKLKPEQVPHGGRGEPELTLDGLEEVLIDLGLKKEENRGLLSGIVEGLFVREPARWRVAGSANDEDGVDAKVAFLSQLPYSVGERYTVQQEIKQRVDVLRSEVLHDMVTELLDMQRELKSKVSSAKLSEIMEVHRDEQLYNTVRTLVADLQEVRVSKLDSQQFIDALRAKADTRQLDSKVETNDLSIQVDAINSSAGKLGRELTRMGERQRQLEISLQNLHSFVMTGGGVHTEAMELRELLTKAEAGDDSGGPGGQMMSMRPTAVKADSLLATLISRPMSAPQSGDGGQVVVKARVGADGSGSEDACGRDAPNWAVDNTSAGDRTALEVLSPKRPLTGSNGLRTDRIARRRPNGSDQGRVGIVNYHAPGGGFSSSPKAKGAAADGGPAGPTMIPMTASQRAYCDHLGLESCATQRTLQAATPIATVQEARELRPM